MQYLLFFTFAILSFSSLGQADSMPDSNQQKNPISFGIEFGPTYGLIQITENESTDWDAYWSGYHHNYGAMAITSSIQKGARLGIFIRKPINEKLGFHSCFNLQTHKSYISPQFDSLSTYGQIIPISVAIGMAFYVDYNIPHTPLFIKAGPNIQYLSRNNDYFRNINCSMEFSILGTINTSLFKFSGEIRYSHGLRNLVNEASINTLNYAITKLNYHSISFLINLRT